jgi:O-antigen ligase
MALWPQLRVPRIALLLVTIAVCLVRARDQPSVDIPMGGTTASIVPGDVLLVALALVAVTELVRRGVPRVARPAALAAAGFCGLIFVTAATNGAAALVSGTKLVELAALALGAATLLRTRDELDAVVDVLLLFTIAADIVGIVKFLESAGGRQASFLGEHDFAALAALPLLYGLALLYERGRNVRAWIAIAAGAVGCILGAALASLLGFYLGVVALVVLAAVARRLTLGQLAATASVVAVVTGGTLVIRAGELGFLQSWFGKSAERPGQYASSWSQRLIFAYIGGRIFVDHPVLGTGWYGNLPPREFDSYLPAARRRFSDQPPAYFPSPSKPFVPQQTYDEVLYELGAVGGALLLALLACLGRNALAASRAARGVAGSLAAAWLAAAIGAIAGEGLFGGTPLAATFWLAAGVVVALGVQARGTV